MDTVNSLRRHVNYYGSPPVVPKVKDPFTHWHPRRQRTMLQKEFAGVPIEQIKAMAESDLIYRSTIA